MGTPYDVDYAAWAREQVALLRAGRLNDIDSAHIAEEIEGVSKAEYHALCSRMPVLIEHLLKWRFQPERRGGSWRRTNAEQRLRIEHLFEDSPSLKRLLDDEKWLGRIWRDGQRLARSETGIETPAHCLWTDEQVLDPDFLPD